MSEYQGKVAIVTGAGQGIGYEISYQLAELGANLILNDVDEKLLEDAVFDIIKTNPDSGKRNCGGIIGNAGEMAIIDEMINLALSEFGRIDYVVANAGITTFGEFLEYPVEEFKKLVELNLQGSFFLSQKGARIMKELGIAGRIVLMSSVTGHQAHSGLTAYGMTKAALRAFAKLCGVELAPYGITVNAISPGATMTERTLQDLDYVTNWGKLTPTGRVTEVEDIASAVLFLLSENSRQITGQTIIVDGGWSATSPQPV